MGAWARGLLTGIILLSVLVTRGDEVLVSCMFQKSCMLPCTFQAAGEEVIHWVKGNVPVHSYYYGADHLDTQHVHFRMRTSLFSDQITRGNASLKLSGSTFEDEGKYKCYASTVNGNKESFIQLKVESPVQKVDIRLIGERITCSSGGIYPEPKLSWVTNMNGSIHNVTNCFPDHQGLYNINSSIPVMTNRTEVVCSVSTTSGERTATLRQQGPVSGSSSATVSIPCGASNAALQKFRVTWTFNHDEPILTYDSAEPTQQRVQEPWKNRVQGVSELGDLQLKGLMPQHGGSYTCELRNDRETYVTLTSLAVRSGQEIDDGQKNIIVIALLLVIGLAAAVAAAVYIRRKQKRQRDSSRNGKNHNTNNQPMLQ